MYSMDDLSTKLNISKQSLYKLIKNNQELSTLINQHSTKEKRKIFYDDEVLDWLSLYYGVDFAREGVSNEVGEGVSQDKKANFPEDTAPTPTSAARIEELEAKLKACEDENQRLREENGALLLTISQLSNSIAQMTTTLKMLPAPRKPILERIKAVFTGKGRQEANNAADPPQSVE